MTANDDTPETGQERTDSDEYPPLMDASDREVSLAVEEGKNDVLSAAEEVTMALNSDSRPLTDEKVHALWKAGEALTALSATLCHRVPPEHQADPEEGRPGYEE